MIQIDGSYLEGGGQIVRTALALSALTGKPFTAKSIRLGRPRPGLKAQHLHCIKALEQICSAKAEGVVLGSKEISFLPGKVKPGEYEVDIGTAGSVTLLLQAVLLPLMFAEGKSRLKVRGGTCGKWAASAEYFQNILLPHLQSFAEISFSLNKRGYFPKGGGEIELVIRPKFEQPKPFELTERGSLIEIKGISHASAGLQSARVAERQAEAAKLVLEQLGCPISIDIEYSKTLSPGSGITLKAVFDEGKRAWLGCDALGEPGKKAEEVGKEAATGLLAEIQSGAPVDRHLGDQLIPFMALATPSSIRVSEITRHCRTNAYVVEKFLPVSFSFNTLIRCCKK